MAYILIIDGQIYGCYATTDLLRTNLMILTFDLTEKKKMKLGDYENVIDYLKNHSFSESTFSIKDFSDRLKKYKIQVETVNHEKNGAYALEKIMNHVDYRIGELARKMERDSRIKVTFPGESAEEHQLGPPYFKDWEWIDSDNWNALTKALYGFIEEKIKDLQERFSDRVRFGEVMYQNASPKSYQVWSANAANWDLPRGESIPGKFQAMEMKFQEPGVYGIVVSPMYGYSDLVPEEYVEKPDKEIIIIEEM